MEEKPTTATPTAQSPAPTPGSADILSAVINRINNSENILVALSSNPSVDEMSAAIGLTLFLDKLGKRATAIYSGATPNALEFLKPEETFESTTDALQDFVIALNKEKADHLRYKLDGEFVKIFITPYRTRISEEDLDFSYGDFNVDLVLALDVANGVDLDSALREHGRIMHDASIINITTGNPGKLGEIEWSDKSASSVSEMVAKLLYNFEGEAKIEKDEATAFLTGIVAATNRFSNAKTTPSTMKLASRLMESGANQQLIAKNITAETENEIFSILDDTSDKTKATTEPTGDQPSSDQPAASAANTKPKDHTSLDIKHDEDKTIVEEAPAPEATTESAPEPAPKPAIESAPEPTTESAPASESAPEPAPTAEKDDALLDDLKAAEESLAHAGAETTPEADDAPLKINSTESEPSLTISATGDNPAMANTPATPAAPEINGVPEINYMPMPGDEILPPPPTPPIAPLDTNMAATTPPPATPAPEQVTPIVPATPAVEPTLAPLGAQPAMQDQIYTPQASDPGAFKIPGM
ncbi:hypothetical protein IKF73_02820 [Candidatus Saccharibacteria bacterium]|nr:hypothetical protein [Candidatus Saccharibacteria bacterium]